jgi:hypothetical protein
MMPRNPNAPVFDIQQQTFGYQQGGMVTPSGPAPMGAGLQQQGQQSPISPQMMQMQIQKIMTEQPQAVAQIRNVIMESLQTGELSQQELSMMVQLATVAAQNPQMYPQLRQYAIQQGLATEQDLPAQYDQGLIFVLLLAGRAAQQAVGGGANVAQGEMPVRQMAGGGPVSGAGTETSDSIPARLSDGEYIIPANVVRMKGKEFFDSLLEKYKEQ